MAKITTPDAVSGQTEHTAAMYNAMKAAINGAYDGLDQLTENQAQLLGGNTGDTLQSLRTALDTIAQSLQNLKTLNGESLLGGGNISLDGSGQSITIDATPTADSANAVQSGAVFTALQAIQTAVETANDTAAQALAALGNYMPQATYDANGDGQIDPAVLPEFEYESTPTANSTALITSGAVYALKQELLALINPPQ